MNALDSLQARLATEWEAPLRRLEASATPLDGHIAQLQKRLKQGAAAYVPRDLQQEEIRRFWTEQSCKGLRSAQLISFGIALPVGPKGLRIIEDEGRFSALLLALEQYRSVPRQFRRCYRGLLSGYFAYDPDDERNPQTGRRNWAALRSYLKRWSTALLAGPHNPQWAESLQTHTTLFDNDPCARYGPLLLDGKSETIDALRADLGISDSSWFMRKLYIAQVVAATQRQDRDFLNSLPPLLSLLRENSVVRDEGFAHLLNRYASILPSCLNPQLRDAAVAFWGNPWLQSNAMRWGRVTSDARAMVVEWLKLEFIEAFFTLLAEERSGDGRRLAFWRRYVNQIDNIHFALGWQALNSINPDFVTLRKKMDGLVASLRDTVGSNNAFIMQIGRLVIVEFSGYSNALYGYDTDSGVPFSLENPVVMPVNSRNSLKHSKRALWLKHQDGVLGFAKWEDQFESILLTKYGIYPDKNLAGTVKTPARSRVDAPRPVDNPDDSMAESKPLETSNSWFVPSVPNAGRHVAERATSTPADRAKWMATAFSREALLELANQFGFRIEDLTREGGNLWARTTDRRLLINDVLTRWGFRYKDARKGWWVRGK
jgi:hypothetical protein